MSPQWRDELLIWLAPNELRLRRMRRGIRAECVGETTHPLEGTSDWSPALSALESCLATQAWSRTAARVVVSNRLVRYAIVPWTDALTREAEHLAHARICLADNYGNTGPDWRVCISEAAPGDARVACAIPGLLYAELRTLLNAQRIPLISVQPALIDAYNRCRNRLPGSARWFVNIEPGMLVAARLAPKCWESVYSARTGEDWPTELRRLRVFAKLAAQNPADALVYVDAPESLLHGAEHEEPGIEWLASSDEAVEDSDQRQPLSLTS